MLDIKIIRENPEKVNELLKRRNPELSIDEILEIGNSSLSKMAYDVFEWILKRSWEKVGRSKPTLTNVCDQFNITKTVAEKVWKEIRDFYHTEPIFVV